MNDIFYTYIYYDPSRNNEPFYVGKGNKKRAWDHLKRKNKHPFVQRLQKMRKNNIKPIIGLYSGLDEASAFVLEIKLIAEFGRKDLGKGPLLNLTDGGEGPANPSIHTRNKISKALRGKKRTQAQNLANSLHRKGKPNGRKGKKQGKQKPKPKPHGNKGKVRTQEFKDNLSQMYIGKKAWNKNVKSKRTEYIHCGKFMDAGNMKQSHGDKCKLIWISLYLEYNDKI